MGKNSFIAARLGAISARLRPLLRRLGSPYMRALLAIALLAVALAWLGSIDLQTYQKATELFLVFICLAYLASLARARLRDGLVVAGSLVLGLAALEMLAIASEKKSLPVQGKGFSTSDKDLGWAPARPGAYPARKTDPTNGAVVFDVVYTIDDQRLRKTLSSDTGQTIAFFGDSFTFGEGVRDDETMPQAFADLTERKAHVLNMGFPGYGPQQFLRAIETGLYDEALGEKPRLFVFLTAPWHAERTACRPAYTLRAPRYERVDERIVYAGACSAGARRALREWVENTALYRVAVEPYRKRVDHDDIDLYIRILLAAVDLVKKKYGAATLVPYMPAGDSYLRGTGFTDAEIVGRLRDGGARVVDASLARQAAEGLVIGIPGDGHPTALAHRARAQAIEDYIRREMPEIVVSQD